MIRDKISIGRTAKTILLEGIFDGLSAEYLKPSTMIVNPMQMFSFKKYSCVNLWDFIFSAENNVKILQNPAKSIVSKVQNWHAQKKIPAYQILTQNLAFLTRPVVAAVVSFGC